MTEEEKQTATILEAGEALESQISQLQTVNKEREGQVSWGVRGNPPGLQIDVSTSGSVGNTSGCSKSVFEILLAVHHTSDEMRMF